MNNADFTLQECDGVLIVVDENSTEKESAVDTWLEKATKHKVRSIAQTLTISRNQCL
jgi:hypothetical protein